MKGIIVVLYGVNNTGKSTQGERLVERLREKGFPAFYQKHAVYDILPSGKMIDEYLRSKNPKGRNPYGLSPREFQTIYALNRTQNQPYLQKMLNDGHIAVLEDYTGTGIAWGLAHGVEREYLDEINSHLLVEEIAFHFYGERFVQGQEKGHLHEDNASLMERAICSHEQLAKEKDWIPIYNQDPVEVITEKLLSHILNYIQDHESEK